MKKLFTTLIMLIGFSAYSQMVIMDFSDWNGDGLDDNFIPVSGKFHILSSDPQFTGTAQHGQGNMKIKTGFPLSQIQKTHNIGFTYRSTSPVIITLMITSTMSRVISVCPASPDQPIAWLAEYYAGKQWAIVISSAGTCLQLDDFFIDAQTDQIPNTKEIAVDYPQLRSFDLLGRIIK